MEKKREEGVPALQNEDVTGMRKKEQEEVVEESGRAPRDDAARAFYDEQEDQAQSTDDPAKAGDKGGARPTSPPKGERGGKAGQGKAEQGTEQQHRWEDASKGSAAPGKGDKNKKQ